MRFRVEKRDLIIFVVFCFFLLYMCSIGVLNASSLATTGKFYGIVPFKAFTADYIATTLTLFVLSLIGIFAACSSYIFDREKGFGFVYGKKDKGYSRWCKDGEMKRKLTKVDIKSDKLDSAGIPLISDGRNMWVDAGEDHYLVMGATGSGKTVIVAKPMIKLLAKAGESMVVTDPKGELYEASSDMLREKGYNIVVLNFRDPQRGNAWNPMALPYSLYRDGNSDKAIELLDDLALNILYEEKSGGSDPFWEKAGADYFSGLALGLFEDAKPEEINLNSINLMSNVGEERFGGPNNNYIKEYYNSKDPSKPAYINASGTVFTAEETKQGILATFKQKIKLFSSRDNLSEMLSHSDFDMKDIGKQKTAVFMVVQDEKKTLHPLATVFIKQCYETLIDVAQECGGHLPYRTNFILDEFANMPPLKDVTTMVTAARSRHIKFTFIIQNFAQLTKVYGKDDGETIKGNCNLVYLISSELAALEEISKMCGEVKSKEKDKTASTPLVTVSDLQRLSKFEIIILLRRMMPYKKRFKTDFEVDWGRKYEKAEFPTRERKPVALFDLKAFVKEMKKAKAEEMLGSSKDGMPPLFGGGMPPMGMGGMGGPLSFGDMLPFGAGSSPKSSEDSTSSFEKMLEKIDKEINRIEASELQEKAKKDEVKPLLVEEKPKDELSINQLVEKKVTDDDFFDDFFDDQK